jgi:hypothetical protein
MKLSIDKFQRLQGIASIESDDVEKASRLVQVLLDKSSDEIEEMHIKDFTLLCEKLKTLFDIKIDSDTMSKPKNIIKANGKRYHINYEIKKPFNTGRYIEVLTFSKEDPIVNMHNILASICTPMVWSWRKLRYVKDKYNVFDHEDYADDLRQADFRHGYHAMVFFYLFLMTLTESSNPSLDLLMTERMKIGRNQKRLKNIFPNLSDGFTTRSR